MIELSVIIPTRNRAELLKRTLDSIMEQDLPQEYFEVIVINNGSTDNTADICRIYQKKIRNFQYFLEEEPGLHVGRHRGMLASRSDCLVYADDDIRAFPTWLSSIRESFHDSDTVLIGGSDLPDYESPPPKWMSFLWTTDGNTRILTVFSVIDLGKEKRIISPYYVFGCNFAVRKSILLKAGGFHPDGMPDSLLKFRGDGETHVAEYIMQNNLKTVFNPEASVYHCVPSSRMTIAYIKRIGYRTGISNAFTEIRAERKKRYTIIDMFILKMKALWCMLKFTIPYPCRIFEYYRLQGIHFLSKAAFSEIEVMRWIKKDCYYNK